MESEEGANIGCCGFYHFRYVSPPYGGATQRTPSGPYGAFGPSVLRVGPYGSFGKIIYLF